MGRIAIIETYPYEDVWGGDAVYLDALRRYLTERVHTVDSYVTDLTRGRSNPAVTLRTEAKRNHCWHVRNAFPLGSKHFCSFDGRMLRKALRRLPGRRVPEVDRVESVEGEWIEGELKGSPPDLAILAFGACCFAERLSALGIPLLALKGFFSDRHIRLGEEMATPTVSAELLRSLGHADRVGFNNRHDLELYEQLSERNNGGLVAMGFPRRIQAPANANATLLFVAARTRPNVESFEWFLDQVWPLILKQVACAELRVAGSISTAFSGRAFPGVRFLGFVESLEAEYRRACAAVAPLLLGSSGVKTKVAEAISFGRPVVTTSLGVDPADPHQYGEAVFVADEPELFAAIAIKLLSDPDYSRKRAEDAAKHFELIFAEDVAYREVTTLLGAIAAKRVAAA